MAGFWNVVPGAALRLYQHARRSAPTTQGGSVPSHALSAENEKKADPSMRMPPRTYTLFAAGLLFGCSSSSGGTAAKGSGGSSGSGGVGHNGGS
jgi:hypothetical protein